MEYTEPEYTEPEYTEPEHMEQEEERPVHPTLSLHALGDKVPGTLALDLVSLVCSLGELNVVELEVMPILMDSFIMDGNQIYAGQEVTPVPTANIVANENGAFAYADECIFNALDASNIREHLTNYNVYRKSVNARITEEKKLRNNAGSVSQVVQRYCNPPSIQSNVPLHNMGPEVSNVSALKLVSALTFLAAAEVIDAKTYGAFLRDLFRKGHHVYGRATVGSVSPDIVHGNSGVFEYMLGDVQKISSLIAGASEGAWRIFVDSVQETIRNYAAAERDLRQSATEALNAKGKEKKRKEPDAVPSAGASSAGASSAGATFERRPERRRKQLTPQKRGTKERSTYRELTKEEEMSVSRVIEREGEHVKKLRPIKILGMGNTSSKAIQRALQEQERLRDERAEWDAQREKHEARCDKAVAKEIAEMEQEMSRCNNEKKKTRLLTLLRKTVRNIRSRDVDKYTLLTSIKNMYTYSPVVTLQKNRFINVAELNTPSGAGIIVQLFYGELSVVHIHEPGKGRIAYPWTGEQLHHINMFLSVLWRMTCVDRPPRDTPEGVKLQRIYGDRVLMKEVINKHNPSEPVISLDIFANPELYDGLEWHEKRFIKLTFGFCLRNLLIHVFNEMVSEYDEFQGTKIRQADGIAKAFIKSQVCPGAILRELHQRKFHEKIKTENLHQGAMDVELMVYYYEIRLSLVPEARTIPQIKSLEQELDKARSISDAVCDDPRAKHLQPVGYDKLHQYRRYLKKFRRLGRLRKLYREKAWANESGVSLEEYRKMRWAWQSEREVATKKKAIRCARYKAHEEWMETMLLAKEAEVHAKEAEVHAKEAEACANGV